MMARGAGEGQVARESSTLSQASLDNSLFPFKQDMDESSVARVMTILEANILQWGFIESQLLEPNVNLNMPEIFVPLRHLTTTLEVLGHILYIRNDMAKAKDALERACPLLELLPVGTNEEHKAVNCFELLRQVYTHINDSSAIQSGYPDELGGETLASKSDLSSIRGPHHDRLLAGLVGSLEKSGLLNSKSQTHLDSHDTSKNINSATGTRRRRQHVMEEAGWSSGLGSNVELDDDRVNRVDGVAACDIDDHTGTCATEAASGSNHSEMASHTVGATGEVRMQIEQRLEEIRSPFEHLRRFHPAAEELTDLPDWKASSMETAGTSQREKAAPKISKTKKKGIRNNKNAADKRSSQKLESVEDVHPPSPDPTSQKPLLPKATGARVVPSVVPDGQNSTHQIMDTDIDSQSVWAEAGVSDTMLRLLHNYVAGNEEIRREVLHEARQHYADLHMNVEEFDSPEVVLQLSLADAYLAVMHKATQDGFHFIRRELRDYWGSAASDRNGQAIVKLDELLTSFSTELSVAERARLTVLALFDHEVTAHASRETDPDMPSTEEKRSEEFKRTSVNADVAEDIFFAKRGATAPPSSRSARSKYSTSDTAADKFPRKSQAGNIPLYVTIALLVCTLGALTRSFILEQQRRLRKGLKPQPLMTSIGEFLIVHYYWGVALARMQGAKWLEHAADVEVLRHALAMAGVSFPAVKTSGSGSTKKSSGKTKPRRSKVGSSKVVVSATSPMAPGPDETAAADAPASQSDDSSESEESDTEDLMPAKADALSPIRHSHTLSDTQHDPAAFGSQEFILVSKEQERKDREKKEQEMQLKEKQAREREKARKKEKELATMSISVVNKAKETVGKEGTQSRKDVGGEVSVISTSSIAATTAAVSKRDRDSKTGFAEKKGPSPPTSGKRKDSSAPGTAPSTSTGAVTTSIMRETSVPKGTVSGPKGTSVVASQQPTSKVEVQPASTNVGAPPADILKAEGSPFVVPPSLVLNAFTRPLPTNVDSELDGGLSLSTAAASKLSTSTRANVQAPIGSSPNRNRDTGIDPVFSAHSTDGNRWTVGKAPSVQPTANFLTTSRETKLSREADSSDGLLPLELPTLMEPLGLGGYPLSPLGDSTFPTSGLGGLGLLGLGLSGDAKEPRSLSDPQFSLLGNLGDDNTANLWGGFLSSLSRDDSAGLAISPLSVASGLIGTGGRAGDGVFELPNAADPSEMPLHSFSSFPGANASMSVDTGLRGSRTFNTPLYDQAVVNQRHDSRPMSTVDEYRFGAYPERDGYVEAATGLKRGPPARERGPSSSETYSTASLPLKDTWVDRSARPYVAQESYGDPLPSIKAPPGFATGVSNASHDGLANSSRPNGVGTGSGKFGKPFPEIERDTLPINEDLDITSAYRSTSGLSASASSFQPSKGFVLPPAENSSHEVIKLVLLCHIDQIPVQNVVSVKVISPIPQSVHDQEFLMRRSSTDLRLWAVSIQIPRSTAFFEYSYVLLTDRESSWREQCAVRTVNLTYVPQKQVQVELNDFFQTPIRVDP